jgi:hypothetical protein
MNRKCTSKAIASLKIDSMIRANCMVPIQINAVHAFEFAHAAITDRTLTAGTGIVVGLNSRVDCTVTAHGNNFSGDIVSVQNL